MTKFIYVLLFTIISFSFSAQAKVTCSDANNCVAKSMRHFDQNHTSLLPRWKYYKNGTTNLCGPTAVAMALDAVMVGQGLGGKKGSNSYVFNRKKVYGQYGKIEYMAKKLNTTKAGGTYFTTLNNYYAARVRDFGAQMTSNKFYVNKSAAITRNRLMNQLKANRVPVLNFGWYKRSCKLKANGTYNCVYTRNGGHIMPLKAINNAYATFNDPTKSNGPWRTKINKLKRNVNGKWASHVLPSHLSFSTAYYLGNGGNLLHSFSSFGRKK